MDIAIPESIHGLRLRLEHWQLMVEDVQNNAPEEACGIVAGLNYDAEVVIPITNALHSPARYQMDPQEQVEAFNQIDREGLDLLAIYHSHPSGPPEPSASDIDESQYPEVIYLIWSIPDRKWICRGFLIQEGKYLNVPIFITAEE